MALGSRSLRMFGLDDAGVDEIFFDIAFQKDAQNRDGAPPLHGAIPRDSGDRRDGLACPAASP
jgi:hypothetical protein